MSLSANNNKVLGLNNADSIFISNLLDELIQYNNEVYYGNKKKNDEKHNNEKREALLVMMVVFLNALYYGEPNSYNYRNDVNNILDLVKFVAIAVVVSQLTHFKSLSHDYLFKLKEYLQFVEVRIESVVNAIAELHLNSEKSKKHFHGRKQFSSRKILSIDEARQLDLQCDQAYEEIAGLQVALNDLYVQYLKCLEHIKSYIQNSIRVCDLPHYIAGPKYDFRPDFNPEYLFDLLSRAKDYERQIKECHSKIESKQVYWNYQIDATLEMRGNYYNYKSPQRQASQQQHQNGNNNDGQQSSFNPQPKPSAPVDADENDSKLDIIDNNIIQPNSNPSIFHPVPKPQQNGDKDKALKNEYDYQDEGRKPSNNEGVTLC